DERLAPAVKVVAPGIPPAAREDLQPFRLGPKLPNAASAQSPNAVGRLDVAMDVDGLIHVEHAVRAPAKGVQHVMGVFGAETGQDDLAAGGFAFAVGVAEMEEVGAGGDVDAAIARFDASRDKQAVGEDGCLVGAAFAVGVFEDDDLVVLGLAGLDLWV